MRQVVLDTETTGLDAARGHRVIEIGCIELRERRRTGREFHRYLNPQREVDRGAAEVHGLTDEFLADKPLFAQVAADFLEFIDGAELIIHNAAFDLGFLDAELARLPAGGRIAERCSVLDTLKLARERYPGQRNSLDALCKRLAIDNSQRDLHGALLDANLLAEVYLSMTAGQGEMSFESEVGASARGERLEAAPVLRGQLRVLRADAQELAHHESRLDAVAKAAKRPPVWRTLDA